MYQNRLENHSGKEGFSLELVPPTEQSASLIMEWRNDPHSLANSFDGRRKIWPDFFDDFRANYFGDQSLPALFI
ncbi:hypothetical protein ABTE17_20710, partial [Acinetobacter baumannii]